MLAMSVQNATKRQYERKNLFLNFDQTNISLSVLRLMIIQKCYLYMHHMLRDQSEKCML